jgi:hypothetical protein
MSTSIPAHPALAADQPIEVLIGFSPAGAAEPGWAPVVQGLVGLFAQFVRAGGFVASFPGLRWNVGVIGSSLRVVFRGLPPDPSCLPVLARMFLALTPPPVAIQVRGTPAAAGVAALPSTPSALALLPRTRQQLAFSVEMEPGMRWLNIDVSVARADLALAQLVDERIDLWCSVARSGGLSGVAPDLAVVPGNVGKAAPAVGVDFITTEIGYDSVAVSAPAALLNLLDDLARTQVLIEHVSIR